MVCEAEVDMKRLLRALLQKYWRWKFSRKATILGEVFFGRHTRIALGSGSHKGNIIIGAGAKVYGSLISESGGKIVIGEGAHVGPYTTVGAVSSVNIGEYAMISSHVDIMDNNNHPVHPEDRLKMNKDGVNSHLKRWVYSASSPVKIGENTWVGKKAIILKGVELGANSIVATGAVVTKSVKPKSLVAVNPSKVRSDNISEDQEA